MLIKTLTILILLTAQSFAEYSPEYIRRFIGKEAYVTLESRERKANKEVLVYVMDVDLAYGVLIGQSNEGTYHLDVSKIMDIREQIDNVSGVRNHH